MNLEGLEEYIGMELPYNELCKILDEEKKTGNSKIKQLKDWQLCISLEKIKTKYKIIEVYDSPMASISGSQYISAVEFSIQKMLNGSKSNIFSYNEIFKELKMVKEGYFKISYEPSKYFYLVDNLKMPNPLFEEVWEKYKDDDLYRFLRMSKYLMKCKLNYSFKSISKRGAYQIDKVYKYGRQGVKHFESRNCTQEENDVIFKLREDKLILLFGINDNNETRLFCSTRKVKEKFEKEINELTAYKAGYEFNYKCVKITKLKDIILRDNHFDFNADIADKMTVSKELNDVVNIPNFKNYLINELIKKQV